MAARIHTPGAGGSVVCSPGTLTLRIQPSGGGTLDGVRLSVVDRRGDPPGPGLLHQHRPDQARLTGVPSHAVMRVVPTAANTLPAGCSIRLTVQVEHGPDEAPDEITTPAVNGSALPHADLLEVQVLPSGLWTFDVPGFLDPEPSDAQVAHAQAAARRMVGAARLAPGARRQTVPVIDTSASMATYQASGALGAIVRTLQGLDRVTGPGRIDTLWSGCGGVLTGEPAGSTPDRALATMFDVPGTGFALAPLIDQLPLGGEPCTVHVITDDVPPDIERFARRLRDTRTGRAPGDVRWVFILLSGSRFLPGATGADSYRPDPLHELDAMPAALPATVVPLPADPAGLPELLTRPAVLDQVVSALTHDVIDLTEATRRMT